MQITQSQATVVAAGEGKKLNVMGHSVTVKLSKYETEGNYYVFEVVTPPGNGIPPHVHDREDELIYVLEREYAIMLGEQQFTAHAGDEIFFPRHVPHAFQNISTKAGRTLWTVIPGGNFEDFFEELSAFPVDREPDMGRVVQIFVRYGMEILIPEKA